MPITGIVFIIIGAISLVGLIVWWIFGKSSSTDKWHLSTIFIVLIGFVGVVVPVVQHDDAVSARQALQERHQVTADVARAHPDFHIQSINIGNGTITYIRPGNGSDPYLCSAKVLRFRNVYLVATVGAQCAPYTT